MTPSLHFDHRHIVLFGLMGAGKTQLGPDHRQAAEDCRSPRRPEIEKAAGPPSGSTLPRFTRRRPSVMACGESSHAAGGAARRTATGVAPSGPRYQRPSIRGRGVRSGCGPVVRRSTRDQRADRPPAAQQRGSRGTLERRPSCLIPSMPRPTSSSTPAPKSRRETAVPIIENLKAMDGQARARGANASGPQQRIAPFPPLPPPGASNSGPAPIPS